MKIREEFVSTNTIERINAMLDMAEKKKCKKKKKKGITEEAFGSKHTGQQSSGTRHATCKCVYLGKDGKVVVDKPILASDCKSRAQNAGHPVGFKCK